MPGLGTMRSFVVKNCVRSLGSLKKVGVLMPFEERFSGSCFSRTDSEHSCVAR